MPLPVADLLRELETVDDDATIEVAAEALAEGAVAPDALRRLAADERSSVRRAAVLALARRRDPEGRAVIEACLGDATERVRQDACRALAALGDPRSAQPVAAALRDPRPGVRAAAAQALAGLGGAPSALAALLEGERVTTVRRAALDALARLGGDEALQALAVHVGREDDRGLAALAADHVVALAQRDGRGDGQQLLSTFRRVPAASRRALADALGVDPALGEWGRGVEPGSPLARITAELRALRPDPQVLARFGSDLTARATTASAPRTHGRDREVEALLARLGRDGSKSIVLVGPAGAGKTAIVHELARRLAAEPVLVPTAILEATTGEVISGTRFLGEWQTRLKELSDAVRAPHRAVWYVPDVNRLVDAGTTAHSDESFAAMLGPAVERGDVVIVGESTPDAFRRGLDRHPNFGRLFQRLAVDETDRAATLGVLAGVRDDLVLEQARRGVDLSVTDAALEHALDLAQDHLPALARPGNAIHLLREAVAAQVEGRAGQKQGEPSPPGTQSGGWAWPADAAPDLAVRHVVDPSSVLRTLSALTGVPAHLLDDTLPLDLEATARFFHERVLGQDGAVEAVVDLISLIKAGLTDPTRPLGALLFVGPTGVGKTEMAKAIAEFIFGDAQDRLVRVDLGEFKEPDAHRRLVGDPQALDPASRQGLLTAPVREKPFSVVLLDEVEKAHRNVFDLLLPLLAEGRLVDEQGRVTDFRRAIIVMTSNLGSDLREDLGLGFATVADLSAGAGAKVLRALEDAFRPEFVNRIGRVVGFAPLTTEVMRRLTRREVRRVLARRGIVRRGVVVETDDAVIGTLCRDGFSERYGARPLKRRVEELLLKPLARALLQVGPEEAGSPSASQAVSVGPPNPAIIRLGVSGDRVVSEVIRPTAEQDDEPPPRATARVKDATGRLVAADDLAARVSDLFERVVALADNLEGQRLRERKSHLLALSSAADFWSDKARASAVLSEVAALEQAIEAPAKLERRLERLEESVGRLRGQTGESRALHDVVTRVADAGRDVELAEYAARCPSARDRGDAWILLRLAEDQGIDPGAKDEPFPEDVVTAMARMLMRYAKRKGLAARVVHEGLTRAGTVREAGLRVEGPCAFGLLKGEAGLHQWVHRGETRRDKRATLARVTVLPPAEAPLRPQDVSRERRAVRGETGVLIEKPRAHLVLTHLATLLAVDGGVDADDAEEASLELLAARVAHARRGEREPGVVRRYVLSNNPVMRDLATGVKLHLDRALEGELDEVVLARLPR